MKQLATRDIRSDQKRVDLRAGRTFQLSGNEITLAVVVQNLFDDKQDLRLENNIDRRIYGSATVHFK
jgi:hypothetical protein